jgi:hypothetical protein
MLLDRRNKNIYGVGLGNSVGFRNILKAVSYFWRVGSGGGVDPRSHI